MKRNLRTLVVASCLVSAVGAIAQGMGQGNRADMATIHQLMSDHKKVRRTVTKLENGVETLTESTDSKVVTMIKEHALAMQKRVKEGRPIRIWDPLFAELFKNHDKISMTVSMTKNGVRVVETSKDPYTVTLIQWHAEGVNGFVKDGMAAMHKEHPAPPKIGENTKSKFLGIGDGINTCPVTGEPVSKSISAKIQDKTVYFCCAGCIEKVVKTPAKYLRWAK